MTKLIIYIFKYNIFKSSPILNNNHKSNTQITPYLLNNLQVKFNKYIDLNLLPLDGIDKLHLKKTCAIRKLPFSTNCNDLIYLIRHLTVPRTLLIFIFMKITKILWSYLLYTPPKLWYKKRSEVFTMQDMMYYNFCSSKEN